MQIEIDNSTLSLARDGLVAVRDAQGATILCHSGAVWITQEGDVKDAIVAAGESFTIRNPGLTLVTGLQASDITLIEPGPQHDLRAQGALPYRIGGLKSEPAPCI